MKRYCKYCSKECYKGFCSDECRIQYEEYIQYVNRYKIPFLLGIFLPLTLMLFPIFFGHLQIFTGIILFLSGTTMALLPFCTGETVETMGVVHSKRIGRTGGIAILIAGAILMITGMLL